jgi:hypothetical protein
MFEGFSLDWARVGLRVDFEYLSWSHSCTEVEGMDHGNVYDIVKRLIVAIRFVFLTHLV